MENILENESDGPETAQLLSPQESIVSIRRAWRPKRTRTQRELVLEAKMAALEAENAFLRRKLANVTAAYEGSRRENAFLRGKLANVTAEYEGSRRENALLRRDRAEILKKNEALESMIKAKEHVINAMIKRTGSFHDAAGFASSRLINNSDQSLVFGRLLDKSLQREALFSF
jgi:chromosome segregation ATPase